MATKLPIVDVQSPSAPPFAPDIEPIVRSYLNSSRRHEGAFGIPNISDFE